MTIFNRLDPEEVREVLAMHQQSCAKVDRNLDGWLGPLLGDAVVAYFGYPIAHGDDPLRSVRCGLAIQEAINKLVKCTGYPPKVRVSVHRILGYLPVVSRKTWASLVGRRFQHQG